MQKLLLETLEEYNVSYTDASKADNEIVWSAISPEIKKTRNILDIY